MDFTLREHTILLTVAGSRAYGIHTPESDIDTQGVAIPPNKYFTGFLSNFKQANSPEHIAAFTNCFTDEEREIIARTKLEGVIFDIRKFMKLAADANPNILDALFCRDEDVRFITPLGQKLRDNRELFISAKAKHTFSGYAFEQLKKIKRHRRWLLEPIDKIPARADFGLLELPKIPTNQLQAAEAAIAKKLDSWEIDFLDVEEAEKIYIIGQIEDYLTEIFYTTDAKWKCAARAIGYDENFLVLLDKERKFKRAKDDYKHYRDWLKKRNPARAALEAKHGYDTKHGGHLYRLMRMCREILTTGQVNVYRGGIDAEEILAIRHGRWTYDRLVEWAELEDKALSIIAKDRSYSIPHAPNRVKIDNLCQDIVNTALRG